MNAQRPSKLDLALASVCRNCPVCRTARRRQIGLAFWLVSKLDSRFCPFCRAFERVHRRKAHEPAAEAKAS